MLIVNDPLFWKENPSVSDCALVQILSNSPCKGVAIFGSNIRNSSGQVRADIIVVSPYMTAVIQVEELLASRDLTFVPDENSLHFHEYSEDGSGALIASSPLPWPKALTIFEDIESYPVILISHPKDVRCNLSVGFVPHSQTTQYVEIPGINLGVALMAEDSFDGVTHLLNRLYLDGRAPVFSATAINALLQSVTMPVLNEQQLYSEGFIAIQSNDNTIVEAIDSSSDSDNSDKSVINKEDYDFPDSIEDQFLLESVPLLTVDYADESAISDTITSEEILVNRGDDCAYSKILVNSHETLEQSLEGDPQTVQDVDNSHRRNMGYTFTGWQHRAGYLDDEDADSVSFRLKYRKMLIAVVIVSIVLSLGATLLFFVKSVYSSALKDNSAPEPMSVVLDPQSVKADCSKSGSVPPIAAFAGEKSINKAWICAQRYGLPGQTITISLDREYVITSIAVIPGYDFVSTDGIDYWKRHGTVETLDWHFDRRTIQDNLNSFRDLIVLTIPQLRTDTIKGVITKVKKAKNSRNKIVDFAISKIEIRGYTVQN